MFLLLTLNIFHTFSGVSIVDFEQGNVNWVSALCIMNVSGQKKNTKNVCG